MHVVPGITAKTYTIISEYMRYKYNPNAPYKWGRAHKILLIYVNQRSAASG